MSGLERRLQILLDDHRYSLLEAEAARTNASIGAIVRQAIDLRFADEQAVRVAATGRLLALPIDDTGTEPDWVDVKVDLEAELGRGIA